jgi:hypothetical protein
MKYLCISAILLLSCSTKNPISPETGLIEMSEIQNTAVNQKRTLSLSVGINTFPDLPGHDLGGCVNDALAMGKFFEQNFDNCLCSVYIDKIATKNNIISTLNTIVNLSKSDRSVTKILLFVSTHGCHMIDRDGDEQTGLDQGFLCYDSRKKGIGLDPDYVILDDDLYNIFSQVPDRVSVEVWLDCCFSGTGLRKASSGDRVKYIENGEIKMNEVLKGLSYVDAEMFHPQKENWVLWAAAAWWQYAQDVYIDGKNCGAFTYAFLKTFSDKKSRKQNYAALLRFLADKKYAQIPQLECSEQMKRTVIK